METPTQPDLRRRIAEQARSMSAWLKLVGVVTILSGIPAALTVIGLLVAWLPIWLGVLLFQAGAAAKRDSDYDLLRLIEKLKTYFIVQGVLVIVALVAMIIAFALFGTVFLEMFEEMRTGGPILEA